MLITDKGFLRVWPICAGVFDALEMGFAEIRGTFFWGPYNADLLLGVITILGVPYYRKLANEVLACIEVLASGLLAHRLITAESMLRPW